MVKNAEIVMTGAQLRAARALLGMRAEDLAQESKVSLRTIRRAEIENGPVNITAANIAALSMVLTDHGVIFIRTPGAIGVSIAMVQMNS